MPCGEIIKSIEHFGRLHIQTVVAHINQRRLQELRVHGPDGELACFDLPQLRNLLLLMVREKRTDVTLMGGNADMYLMMEQKAGGRRVWSLEDLRAPQQDRQL